MVADRAGVVEPAAAAAVGWFGYVVTEHGERLGEHRTEGREATEAEAALPRRRRTRQRPSHLRRSFATWPRPISSSFGG